MRPTRPVIKSSIVWAGALFAPLWCVGWLIAHPHSPFAVDALFYVGYFLVWPTVLVGAPELFVPYATVIVAAISEFLWVLCLVAVVRWVAFWVSAWNARMDATTWPRNER
jgi:hypothetical protein